MGQATLWEGSVKELRGVGPATAKRLEELGVYTIADLATKSPGELIEQGGLEPSLAYSIVEGALRALEEGGFLQRGILSARELLRRREGLMRCTTGSENLDGLLGGGIETQAITEFFGEYGSGKTQIGHTLCVTCQLSRARKGLEGRALYIDTENTFRPERAYQIAQRRGLEPEGALENILVSRAYNAGQLELLTRQLSSIVREHGIRLVVVDSVISLHRAEFTGRATLAERQQRLNNLLHALLRLAEVHNLAVVITNQVQAQPDAITSDPLRPTGGHVLAHAATYRIHLRKAGRERIARLIDSPYHPEGEARFVIGEGGIGDPEGG
jgi:DNA repair protein RadA